MHKKIQLFVVFFLLSFWVLGQQSDIKRHRLYPGASLNIPSKPTNLKYGVGFGLSEHYEYLLWSHWSVIQGLVYKNIFGKTVNEYYENQYIDVDYEYFKNVSVTLGIGFYFGENQRTFFIHFKGGYSWFWAVNPAFPEIIVNEDIVKNAIPREEVNGNFWFFDPKIGWQFNRLQVSLDYHGTVKQDSQINVWSIGLAYNLIKP